MELWQLEAVFMWIERREKTQSIEQRRERGIGGSRKEEEEQKGVRQNYKNALLPFFFFFFFFFFFLVSSCFIFGTASLVHIPNSKPKIDHMISRRLIVPNISKFDLIKIELFLRLTT